MKQDIENRKDIERLVLSFYEKIKSDSLLGPIFNDVAKIDWPAHLPVMFDFWDNTLFFTGGYGGNPMTAHIKLHSMFPLTAQHFAQWTALFTGTVDELFKGDKATLAKQRAISIATVIRIKLSGSIPML
jgi:hemoglobin